MDLFCCIVLTECHTRGCLFVCFVDIFLLLPGVIGRKIAIWKGKI